MAWSFAYFFFLKVKPYSIIAIKNIILYTAAFAAPDDVTD